MNKQRAIIWTSDEPRWQMLICPTQSGWGDLFKWWAKYYVCFSVFAVLLYQENKLTYQQGMLCFHHASIFLRDNVRDKCCWTKNCRHKDWKSAYSDIMRLNMSHIYIYIYIQLWQIITMDRKQVLGYWWNEIFKLNPDQCGLVGQPVLHDFFQWISARL